MLAFAVLFSGLAIVVAVLRTNLTGLATAPPGEKLIVALANLGWLVTIVGLVVSQLVWNRSTRRLVNARGDDGRRYVRHWGVRIYSLTLVLSLVLIWGATSDPWAETFAAALRVAGAAALIAGVLTTRARIRRLLAGPPAPPFEAQRYDLVTGGRPDSRLLLPVTPDADDWNAARWDPEVHADIERRKRRAQP